MSKNPDLTVVDGGASDQTGDENSGGGDGGGKRSTQFISEFQVPYGYEVWADGIYHIETTISEAGIEPDVRSTPSKERRKCLRIVSHKPIWIRRFGRALDTEETLIELAFYDALTQDIQTEWVNRLQLASRQQMIKLARRGVPVHEGNVAQLGYYLDHSIHLNGPKLECVLVAARSGAYELEYIDARPDGFSERKQNWGWLVGNRWIGPRPTKVEADPRNMHQTALGFTTSGDETAWFDMFKQVCSYGPIARWLTYSTFAAPLLRFINQRTFIVHHWGETGGGKSALAKFAMSAWGDPALLTQSFNRTEKSFTEMFKHIDDLPVTFDELQASSMKDHAPLIYALCQERGRGRAGRDGGLQEEIKSWRSVIRMTGEEPIIGKGSTVDLGGQANRAVQIGTPVLSSAQASGIHQWLETKSFGWGGMRFLERLQRALEYPDGADVIKAKYEWFVNAITARVDQQVYSRVLHLAAVALAEYLANRFFFRTEGADEETQEAEMEAATQGALDDALAVAQTIANEETSESLADQALQIFRDHFVAHRRLWLDMQAPIPPGASAISDADRLRGGNYSQLTGVLSNRNEVWLVQKEANMLLQKAGLPQRRVWADFRRLGILRTYDRNGKYLSNACVRKEGQFHAKVYVLWRHMCGGPFTQQDPDQADDET